MQAAPGARCSRRDLQRDLKPSPGGGPRSWAAFAPAPFEAATTTVTTVVKPNASDNSTTTTTTFQVPIQGSGLPPGTFLPLGTSLPAGSTFVAPGAATINAAPPQSASPPQGAGGPTAKPQAANEAASAADLDLNPVTQTQSSGPFNQPGPSAFVPKSTVNIAAMTRGVAASQPAPIFPPRLPKPVVPTPGLVRPGLAGMPSEAQRQVPVASVRRADPNVMPTSAQPTRRGQGQSS